MSPGGRQSRSGFSQLKCSPNYSAIDTGYPLPRPNCRRRAPKGHRGGCALLVPRFRRKLSSGFCPYGPHPMQRGDPKLRLRVRVVLVVVAALIQAAIAQNLPQVTPFAADATVTSGRAGTNDMTGKVYVNREHLRMDINNG